MKKANINWENEQAVSKSFGDIYFSRLGGLEESRQIFLGLNNLENRFLCAQNFFIAELGFGTGLNFLLTSKLWLEKSPPSSTLTYISSELYPMSIEDMRKSLSPWLELKDLSEELISSLPSPIEGVHRLSFSKGRINLILLYGDARKKFLEIELFDEKIDCLFLDGFSPQKNPELWEDNLLQILSANCKPGATLATYSAAGFLRRSLQALNWKVEKVQGFAHKRESLKAEYLPLQNEFTATESLPWFSFNKLKKDKSKHVAVIGAGLAGCWTAYCLAKRGIQVTLIEREEQIASTASGNPAGLAIPYLSLENNLRHEFYLSAFDHCRREVGLLDGNSFEKKAIGAQHFLEASRIESLLKSFEETGVPLEIAHKESDNLLNYPSAFALSPPLLCQRLIEAFPKLIQTKLHRNAVSLEHSESLWVVKGDERTVIAEADTVVIANSYDALAFEVTNWMPLTKIRGELILVEDPSPLKHPTKALCGKGYLIPLSSNLFLAGASYNQVFLDPEPNIPIQEKLLQQAKEEFGVFSEEAKITFSRVGFRASSYDRMPYLGPLPDFSFCLDNYKDLNKGYPQNHYSSVEYLPGLFVNLAHGSRGVVSAPLCAEAIASFITKSPLPFSKTLLPGLLPMRWIIRELSRGRGPQRNLSPEAKFV